MRSKEVGGSRFSRDCRHHAEVVEPLLRGKPIHAPVAENLLFRLDLLIHR